MFTRLQPYAPENIATNLSISDPEAGLLLKATKKLEFAKAELSRKSISGRKNI